jgi:hypothetical protein
MYLQLSTVAHNYNPSNSGGKDQEDCSSGQSKQKISKTPTSTEKKINWNTCHHSDGRKTKIGVLWSARTKSKNLSLK